MSPDGARTWRAMAAVAIWAGLAAAIISGAFIMLMGLSELGSYDCGTACEERMARHEKNQGYLTYLAIAGGIAFVAGIAIRLRVPDPDAT